MTACCLSVYKMGGRDDSGAEYDPFVIHQRIEFLKLHRHIHPSPDISSLRVMSCLSPIISRHETMFLSATGIVELGLA